ncbi:MAG: antibiotic biosynthesis monooxygenase [Chloroflexi bacterium]|nr:antibiotic biosynthesis monooxygenase [Chloroflexota bacterium]
MITVTAEFRINDGKEAEAIAAIEKVVAGVSRNEPGALTYTWHRDLKDAAQILVYEVYADEEATKVHRASEHFAEFQKAFASGLFDPGSVKISRFERIAAIDR